VSPYTRAASTKGDGRPLRGRRVLPPERGCGGQSRLGKGAVQRRPVFPGASLFLHRHPVGLGGPGAQVDQLATLAAEGPVRIVGGPEGFAAALGAADFAGFAHGMCNRKTSRNDFGSSRPAEGRTSLSCRRKNQRLQKVMSKATSRSQARGFRSPSGQVKRMLRAYLLALISGMAGSPSRKLTRTICALLPPSMS